MIDGRRVLAVVAARGGSKGFPGKNLQPLAGVPLVRRAGDVARATGLVDRAIVSTDSAEIARVSGLDAPFLRPAELAGDRAPVIDALRHALSEMEARDRVTYDIVVLLEPTSPLRRPAHVEACVETLVGGGFDAVWTVSPINPSYHPLKSLALDADRNLRPLQTEGVNVVARQELGPLYRRNGVAYALTRECVEVQRTFFGRRTHAIVLDDCEYISIDTPWDLAVTEFYVQWSGWT
jgi:CMP-N-acetylneuraminic acid synthetase